VSASVPRPPHPFNPISHSELQTLIRWDPFLDWTAPCYNHVAPQVPEIPGQVGSVSNRECHN